MLVNLVGRNPFYWLFIALGYMQLGAAQSQLDIRTTERPNKKKAIGYSNPSCFHSLFALDHSISYRTDQSGPPSEDCSSYHIRFHHWRCWWWAHSQENDLLVRLNLMASTVWWWRCGMKALVVEGSSRTRKPSRRKWLGQLQQHLDCLEDHSVWLVLLDRSSCCQVIGQVHILEKVNLFMQNDFFLTII